MYASRMKRIRIDTQLVDIQLVDGNLPLVSGHIMYIRIIVQ